MSLWNRSGLGRLASERLVMARSLAGAGALILCLAGCQTAKTVGSTTAQTAGKVVNNAMSPAVNLVSGIANAVTPPRQEDLLEQQRIAMSMRAGPGRFQNPALAEYRERLKFRTASVRSSPFMDQKRSFEHPALSQFQTRVQRGTVTVDPLPDPNAPGGSLKAQIGMPLIQVVIRTMSYSDTTGLSTTALPIFAQ